MVAESPIRHHGALANNLTILPRDIRRRGTSHEVEVQHAAQNIVLQELPLAIINHDIHPIRIEDEHAVSAALTVVEVHRVVPIQVRPRWHTISIAIPDRARVVRRVQHEWVGALAQAVQARAVRQAGPEAHVLALEDEARDAGVEEHVAIVTAAFDGEGEGVLLVRELQLAAVG